jgi:hypothetical protein
MISDMVICSRIIFKGRKLLFRNSGRLKLLYKNTNCSEYLLIKCKFVTIPAARYHNATIIVCKYIVRTVIVSNSILTTISFD